MAKEIPVDGVPLPTPRGPAINEMKQPEASVVNHIRIVNNLSAYPDVQFVFDDESKTLEAHHAILKVRAPAMLTDAKSKKKTWVVQMGKGKSKSIPNHSSALYRLLVYLYTGEIDWSSYNPLQAIEVLFLAKLYNLNHLALINKKHIQGSVTMNNVYEIMKYANRLEVEEVKVICIDFSLQNTDFFTSPRAKELGFDLYQEAAAVLIQHYVKKTKPTVVERKLTMSDVSIVEDFTSVYNSRGESGDLTFKLANDKQVKVHKCILATLSAELDALIRNNPNSVIPTRPQFQETITYPRLTAEAFESLLKFIYYSEKNISLLHATQIYLFAKDYKLNVLLSTLDNVMGTAEVDVPSVLFMLQIAFLEMNDKKELQQSLKSKGLQFVVMHLDRIDFKPLDGMAPIIGTSIVESVQAAVRKHHQNWELMKAHFNKDPKPLPTTSVAHIPVTSPTSTLHPPSSPPPAVTGTSRGTSTQSPAPNILATNKSPAVGGKDEEESTMTEEGTGKEGKEKRQMRTKNSKKPVMEESSKESSSSKDKDGKSKDEKKKK